jgi:hypothetical protein
MTDPDIADLAAYIAAQQAANPAFDAEAVWEEFTYEQQQQGKRQP